MSDKIWEVKMTDHGNIWNVRDESLLGAVDKAIKMEKKFTADTSKELEEGEDEIAPGEPRSAELICSVDG